MQIVSERPRLRRWAGILVLAGGAALLGGCGAMMSQLPLIGLPGSAPPPPEQEAPAPEFRREAEGADGRPRPLTETERAALEAELRREGERALGERRRRIHEPD